MDSFLAKYNYKPKLMFDGSATECYLKIDNYELFTETL